MYRIPGKEEVDYRRGADIFLNWPWFTRQEFAEKYGITPEYVTAIYIKFRDTDVPIPGVSTEADRIRYSLKRLQHKVSQQ